MYKHFKALMVGTMIVAGGIVAAPTVNAAQEEGSTPLYDESAYTQEVANTMKKLDKLYLEFCDTCGVAGDKSVKARREYIKLARGLMQKMNERFDSVNPKAGAGLSDTEVLVSLHALTMMVDILAATELEQESEHPYN